MNKIMVVGIGPGAYEDMTLRAIETLNNSDIIIGYQVYVELIEEHFKGKEFLTTPMKREAERCKIAFEKAMEGKKVSMISSGDSGIYGMAGLIHEVGKDYPDIEVEVIPGITAASSGAAVLGAPLIHDFALISLSDLLTPWEKIACRIELAGKADLGIVIYNPSSKKRADYLQKACDILLQILPEDRICGTVFNIGREGTTYELCTLLELREKQVNMFTTVFIGNAGCRELNGRMVTARGYQI